MDELEVTTEVLQERASVKMWTKRIRAAAKHWENDFRRMRQNMEFAAGFQWPEQSEMDDDRYVANLTLQAINQKVALLYARNPKAVANRRRRLDFQIWDQRLESLQAAAMAQGSQASIASQAMMLDYAQGRMQRDLVDRIGKTLEIVYQWQCDNQQPSFKKQMKQLVRRVITVGVGYVRLNFVRSNEGVLSTSDTESTIVERAKRAKLLVEKIAEGEILEEDPRVETLKMLVNSIGVSTQTEEPQNVNERLQFDFPPATSLIPDTHCRCIDGFVGARWVAQEYFLPLDDVNAWFEADIKVGSNSEVVLYNDRGEEQWYSYSDPTAPKETVVRLFEVFDLNTKSHFFLVDGWRDFVQKPEPPSPATNHFWPWFPLTFNSVESEPGHKASIFPPSDVQLIKSPQREWNRSREGLRSQRRANAPRYVTSSGLISDSDLEKLVTAKPNEVIRINVPPDVDINKSLTAFQPAPIDPQVYNTDPLVQDMRVTLGNQEGPIPASSKSTATAATINEQSRMTVTSSNVDDLDDMLSDLAEAAGEILLKELSLQPTVQRIAGPGAAWPDLPQTKIDFLNEIYLSIIAASSGRPNKALELSNWQIAAPILQAAGANPQFLVRETLKRLDDRLEAEDAIGTGPMSPMPVAPPSGTAAPTAQNQFPPQQQGPQVQPAVAV